MSSLPLHSLSNSLMISMSALLAGCAVVTIGNLLFLPGRKQGQYAFDNQGIYLYVLVFLTANLW